MKKYSAIAIILLISSILAKATPVTPEQARKVALSYMNCSKVTLAADSFTLMGTKASSVEAPAYYVFNTPSSGWVMVSGEDTTVPILAVGENGSFQTEDMPEHVAYWMNRISSKIKSIRKDTSIKQSEEIKVQWSNPRVARKMGVAAPAVHLETALWGQGYSEINTEMGQINGPFNWQCPQYSEGVYCITGCVATAMAEVLHYNKYPQKGKGTIPAYTTSKYKISVPETNIEGFTYNWDIPSRPYYESYYHSINPSYYPEAPIWTDVQKNAVAALMFHLGSMVEMNYGPSSSSATSSKISTALSTYMGYSKATCEYFRNVENPQDWLKMIRAELDAGRPIIYGGQNIAASGGHQFVLEGYDANNMVYINWGWLGQENGWFAYNYLGTEGGSIYSRDDSAILGLAPDPEGSSIDNSSPTIALSITDDPENPWPYDKGFNIVSGSVSSKSFSLSVDTFFNISGFKYSGNIKICLVGQDGTIICDLSSVSSLSLSNRCYFTSPIPFRTFQCTIPDSVTPKIGDYIALFYSTSTGEWRRANRYYGLSPLVVIDKINPFDFGIVLIPDNIKAGNIICPYMLHRNCRLTSETWKLDGTEIQNGSFSTTTGDHILEVNMVYTDGVTETVRKKFTVTD